MILICPEKNPHEELPPEKALLEGRIDIECVAKSFISFQLMKDDLLENQDDEADEPEVKHAEILETQVEELKAKNERLVDLIEDLYYQLKMA